MSWGYRDSDCPPDQWFKEFEIANGKFQSPIDIKTGNYKFFLLLFDFTPSFILAVKSEMHIYVLYRLYGQLNKSYFYRLSFYWRFYINVQVCRLAYRP